MLINFIFSFCGYSIRFGSMATLKGILEEWKDRYYDKKFGKVSL